MLAYTLRSKILLDPVGVWLQPAKPTQLPLVHRLGYRHRTQCKFFHQPLQRLHHPPQLHPWGIVLHRCRRPRKVQDLPGPHSSKMIWCEIPFYFWFLKTHSNTRNNCRSCPDDLRCSPPSEPGLLRWLLVILLGFHPLKFSCQSLLHHVAAHRAEMQAIF